jgi:hypothetical protein
MRFKKIKFDGLVVLIETEDAGGAWEKATTLTSREEPHPDFTAALRAFVPAVLALCELPLAYGDTLMVRGVSLSRDDDGNEGCVVTCLKELGTVPAPLVLNTPHVSERPQGEDGPCTMPGALAEALETLKDEAKAYVRGKRAQADLFAGAGHARA